MVKFTCPNCISTCPGQSDIGFGTPWTTKWQFPVVHALQRVIYNKKSTDEFK